MNATGESHDFAHNRANLLWSGGLEFKGIDSDEAESFVSGIRQKALTEGKEEDDRWIANYASACFTGAALRWHATLDQEIQRDWYRLQKAILLEYSPMFKGIDGTECEDFIHSVRRQVTQEGRQDDNAWICRYVKDRVIGNALRWHASLDEEVQNDWVLLQRAMLSTYSPPNDREMASPRSVQASTESHAAVY